MSKRCSPHLAQGVVGCPEVVPRDLGIHMMGHMHADVMTQKLDPVVFSMNKQLNIRHDFREFMLNCLRDVPPGEVAVDGA